jgi:hypothetical protein
MSLVFNSKTFTLDNFTNGKVQYIGPGKTVSARDDLALSRSAAKPTATFSGLARVGDRLVRTLPLTGALTPFGDASVGIDFAIPVGAASADIDTLCADLSALFASADFKSHLKTGKINF